MSAEYERVIHECEMSLRSAAAWLDMVSQDDLEKALRTIMRADSVGHILEPSLYRAALADGRLEYQRDLIELARALKVGVANLRQRASFAVEMSTGLAPRTGG